MYQELYSKANTIIKKVPCMTFYDTKILYLETDASGMGTGCRAIRDQKWYEQQTRQGPRQQNNVAYSICQQ